MIEKIFAALAVSHWKFDADPMAIAIAMTLVLACFFVAIGLQIYTKFRWFIAWLLGALVLPATMLASELLHSTEWLGVTLIVGGLASTAAAGLGVAAGWLIIRRRNRDCAVP